MLGVMPRFAQMGELSHLEINEQRGPSPSSTYSTVKNIGPWCIQQNMARKYKGIGNDKESIGLDMFKSPFMSMLTYILGTWLVQMTLCDFQ